MAIVFEIDSVVENHANADLGNTITIDASSTTPIPTTYTWSLLDKPIDSAAVVVPFSPTSIQIVVDKVGAYVVNLVVDQSLATEANARCVVSVKSLKKQLDIFGAGELYQYDTTKGWQKKIEELWNSFTRGSSYTVVTVGSEAGADFTTITDALSAINNDYAGKGVPSNSNRYVIEYYDSEMAEDGLIIPEGVDLCGMGYPVIRGAGAGGSGSIVKVAGTLSGFVLNPNDHISRAGDYVIEPIGSCVIEKIVSSNLNTNFSTEIPVASGVSVYINSCQLMDYYWLNFYSGSVESVVRDSIFKELVYETDNGSRFINTSFVGGSNIINSSLTDNLWFDNVVFLSDLTITNAGSGLVVFDPLNIVGTYTCNTSAVAYGSHAFATNYDSTRNPNPTYMQSVNVQDAIDELELMHFETTGFFNGIYGTVINVPSFMSENIHVGKTVRWTVKVTPSFLTTIGSSGYIPGEIGEIWAESDIVANQVAIYNSGSIGCSIGFDLEVKKKVVDFVNVAYWRTLYDCRGFESFSLGSLQLQGSWVTNGAGATVQDSLWHTVDRSVRVNNGYNARRALVSGISDPSLWRVYFWVYSNTGVTGDGLIQFYNSSSFADRLELKLTGTELIWDNQGLGTTTSTITTGVWYSVRLEIDYDDMAGSWTYDGYLDESLACSGVVIAGVGNPLDMIRLEGETEGYICFDDLIIKEK